MYVSIPGRAAMAMDVIEEGGSSSQGEHSGEDEEKKKDDYHVHDNQKVKVEKPNKFRATRPAPLDVLSRVTMNQMVETPRLTIKDFLNVPQC